DAPPSEGTSTSEYSLETYEDFEEGLDNLDQEDISYFQGALKADPGYVQDVEIAVEGIYFDSVVLEYDRMSQDLEQILRKAEETGNIESWLERHERNLNGSVESSEGTPEVESTSTATSVSDRPATESPPESPMPTSTKVTTPKPTDTPDSPPNSESMLGPITTYYAFAGLVTATGLSIGGAAWHYWVRDQD
ncbi:MAG: hypothetical protein ABEI52_04600, partial [Halobacteriaceae archaeon]